MTYAAASQLELAWSERVRDVATIADDVARRAAQFQLVQAALSAHSVHLVEGEFQPGPVVEAHYEPAPAINFDAWLEQREFWPAAGRRGALGPRTGYTFSAGGVGYAILGPRALEAASIWLVRMHARHELFHATHHLRPTKSRADRELEAWLDGFLTSFARIYPLGKKWRPLIDAYEGATERARVSALATLRDFLTTRSAAVRRALQRYWLRRQSDAADMRFVHDLRGLLEG